MLDVREEDIAVIGMAGRFPGANTLSQFWDNLCQGRESIHQFSDDELSKAGIPEKLWKHDQYVKAKGIIDNVEYFDASFFGMSSLEAKILDPQQRMFLLCAFEALENAGIAVNKNKNRIGVFASTGISLYLHQCILNNPEFLANIDEFQLLIGNDKDFLATKVSYYLNLQGPSITIQTGCSSSLACIHYACQSILNGESQIALAGGVSITIPQMQGYLYKKDMIGSPDGHCYAFDERAQGTVKSNGVGVVVLKPLATALKDHDHIYAVIRGTAINNDGAEKVGYTAPSVNQQAAVIKEAMVMADMTPTSITYVETHGTGTLLGDPIEISALKKAFGSTSTIGTCALASLKTNIGHLDVAAGVASFIKACLAIYHEKIPASLNFQELNSKINLVDSPFYVNTSLKEWKDPIRNAGVSAFGMGGTNIHVVLQNSPIFEKKDRHFVKSHILLFSARSKESLENNIKAIATYLSHHQNVSLQDVAYTLQYGREVMPYRFAVVASTVNDLQTSFDITNVQKNSRSPNIVFMFSGQGSQYPGMAADMYAENKYFRIALDDCLQALQPHMHHDLKYLLLNKNADINLLTQTEVTQPALFAVEYAYAKAYLAEGVNPSALLGHSIGEYAAAVMAGIFTLQDTAKLITLRGRLVQSLPSGKMIAIFETVANILDILPKELDIALENAPGVTVVAGENQHITEFSALLAAKKIRFVLLNTSHAFHSRSLDSILPAFAEVVAQTQRAAPSLPIASNVTGTWLSVEEAQSVDYWVAQLRHTVKFTQCIVLLQKHLTPIFMEVGPGRALQSLIYQHGLNETLTSETYLHTLAKLWNLGVIIQPEVKGMRVPLPSYQWNLERYWIEPSISKKPVLISEDKEKNIDDIVMQAWKIVLGVAHIDDSDHFFQLGGNSLTAIQLIDLLPKHLQHKINVVQVYQYPKLMDFKNYIKSLSNNKNNNSIKEDNNSEFELFSLEEEL